MAYEVEGNVKKVGETQTFGDNGFQKAELWLETELDSKYPQTVSIEFVKDGIDKIQGLAEGEKVLVSCNLRGREYNGRVFNSLNGWKVERMGDSSEAPNDSPNSDEPEDDIIF